MSQASICFLIADHEAIVSVHHERPYWMVDCVICGKYFVRHRQSPLRDALQYRGEVDAYDRNILSFYLRERWKTILENGNQINFDEFSIAGDHLQSILTNRKKMDPYEKSRLLLNKLKADSSSFGEEVELEPWENFGGVVFVGSKAELTSLASDLADKKLLEKVDQDKIRLTLKGWSESKTTISANSDKGVPDLQESHLNFDVFLCYNSRQKLEIQRIEQVLKEQGLRVWIDTNLRPGSPILPALEEAMAMSETVAVFVGEDGIGPWQREEIQAALHDSVKEGKIVIPVLLGESLKRPELPSFLRSRKWVDFHNRFDDAMKELTFGITGRLSE